MFIRLKNCRLTSLLIIVVLLSFSHCLASQMLIPTRKPLVNQKNIIPRNKYNNNSIINTPTIYASFEIKFL